MIKNKFIIISDNQAIVQINDTRIKPQQARLMAESATKSFREGNTIVLSPEFDIEDRRSIRCDCSNCRPIIFEDTYHG